MPRLTHHLLVSFALPLFVACAAQPTHQPPAEAIGSLRLIGEVVLPHNLNVQGTTFGGISGVDMRPDGTWYLLSDAKEQPRFYPARLRYDARGFYGVDVRGVRFLAQPGGADPRQRPDPESIRFNHHTHTLYWTGEGNPDVGLDPFVREADTTGAYRRTLPLPAMFRFRPDGTGPADNATFEGMTLAPDNRSAWVLMESPLQQDRPATAPAAAPYPNRLSQFDLRTGALRRQYVYPLDPVTTPGHVNRISEVLAVSATEFLALECSYYQGENRVRLYAFSTQGATDVRHLPALTAATPYRPVVKRLVADLAPLVSRLDNLECLAFGPTLPNGHRTLVMAVDNNFNAKEINQFLAFEILPDR